MATTLLSDTQPLNSRYRLWLLLTQSFWLLQCSLLVVPVPAAAHSRESRSVLLWPPGLTRKIQLIAGFGVPVAELTEESVVYGIILKFSYNIANNVSELHDFQKREIARRAVPSRWEIYSMFETVVNKMGFDGKACILKNICDAASSPLHHNGILGELLHIILTPSATNDNVGRFEVNEFLAAERQGSYGEDCLQLYPECKAGIMELFKPLYRS